MTGNYGLYTVCMRRSSSFGYSGKGWLHCGASWAEFPLISARLSAEMGLVSRLDLKTEVLLGLSRYLQAPVEKIAKNTLNTLGTSGSSVAGGREVWVHSFRHVCLR